MFSLWWQSGARFAYSHARILSEIFARLTHDAPIKCHQHDSLAPSSFPSECDDNGRFHVFLVAIMKSGGWNDGSYGKGGKDKMSEWVFDPTARWPV